MVWMNVVTKSKASFCVTVKFATVGLQTSNIKSTSLEKHTEPIELVGYRHYGDIRADVSDLIHYIENMIRLERSTNKVLDIKLELAHMAQGM